MSVKPDHWIIRMAREEGMIEPFEEALVREGGISYGPSSYGYDFRIDSRFKALRKGVPGVLDPRKIDPGLFEDFEGEFCLLEPGSFILGQSVEYFRIPRDILTICTGKSSYARCGVLTNVTPFEPQWEGHATLSIFNTGSLPVRVYAGQGIAQLIFLEASEECDVSYQDRQGKYQAQKGIALTRGEDRKEGGDR